MNFDSIFELQMSSDPELTVPIFLTLKHAELVNNYPIVSVEFEKIITDYIKNHWEDITHSHKCFIKQEDISILGYPHYCIEYATALVNMLQGSTGDHKQRRH